MKGKRSPESPEPAPGRWDAKAYQSAVKRVQQRSKAELYEWGDYAISAMGYCLSAARRGMEEDPLSELETGLIALWAVVQELRIREEAEKLLTEG